MLYLFLLFVFPSIVVQSSTSCVCTTVECPEEGHNSVVMGNGYAKFDYLYTYHNAQEVVVSASGTITPQSLDQGTETTTCTQKYSRMLEDDGDHNCDAGHILANRLGGYGNLPVNIFPQNAGMNRGTYAQFEGKIYDYMNTGVQLGNLSWIFYYESDKHTMPNVVNYTASFDDGNEFYSLFDNI